jgi:hypothetical protein
LISKCNFGLMQEKTPSGTKGKEQPACGIDRNRKRIKELTPKASCHA